jgi:hypothetical protein
MTQAQEHKIRWFVYTGAVDLVVGRRQRIRHRATMRGFWPGYDVTCSCGWESKTGGGTRRYVAELVEDHKLGLR